MSLKLLNTSVFIKKPLKTVMKYSSFMGHIWPAGHSFPLPGVSPLKRPRQLAVGPVLLHSPRSLISCRNSSFQGKRSLSQADNLQPGSHWALSLTQLPPEPPQWLTAKGNKDRCPSGGGLGGGNGRGLSLKGFNPNCWVAGF